MEVLIIDSSADIIQRLKELLSEVDVIKAIHEAVSCNDAIEKIKATKPAIVLIDINLPDNRSLDCVIEIKKHNKDVTIIALANSEQKIDELQYKLQGVQYFFDKYHEFEKIPATIKSITNK